MVQRVFHGCKPKLNSRRRSESEFQMSVSFHEKTRNKVI